MKARNLITFLAFILIISTVFFFFYKNRGAGDSTLDNNIKCSKYTEARIAKESLPSVQVEGFYSPISHSCMTTTHAVFPSQETYQLTDELTNHVEAGVIVVTDEKLLRDYPEYVRDQPSELKDYQNKVDYFKGLVANPN
jgi:hypothetical protein